MSIVVQGITNLEKQYDKLVAVSGGTEASKVLFEGAKELKREVQRNTRKLGRKTGRLRRAVKAKRMPVKARYPNVSIVAMNRKVAPHTHLVEYGHGGPQPAPAHPFFWPAAQAKNDIVLRGVTKKLAKNVERVGT